MQIFTFLRLYSPFLIHYSPFLTQFSVSTLSVPRKLVPSFRPPPRTPGKIRIGSAGTPSSPTIYNYSESQHFEFVFFRTFRAANRIIPNHFKRDKDNGNHQITYILTAFLSFKLVGNYCFVMEINFFNRSVSDRK